MKSRMKAMMKLDKWSAMQALGFMALVAGLCAYDVRLGVTVGGMLLLIGGICGDVLIGGNAGKGE